MNSMRPKRMMIGSSPGGCANRVGWGLAVVLSLGHISLAALDCTPPQAQVMPQSLTLIEGCQARLHAQVQSVTPFTLQWIKDGQPLPKATNQFLEIGFFTIHDDGAYAVVVSNACGTVTSDPAFLLYSPDALGGDVFPPALDCGLAASSHLILLMFNKAMQAAPISHYQLTPQIKILEAHVNQGNPSVIELITAEGLVVGQPYELTITGQLDAEGNALMPDPHRVALVLNEPGDLPAPGRLLARQACGRLVLLWQGEAMLQQADRSEGPWYDLPLATSPWVWATQPACSWPQQVPARFYRLRLGR